MDSTRWRRVDELLAAALQRPAGERQRFLVEASGGDEALRAEVASLLEHVRDDGFLETPVVAQTARLVATPRASLVGRRLARFEVLAELGAGGMGEVYLALDPKLERQVALKIIAPDLADDPDQVRRFRREALAASALNHPNIVTVHEVDEADGCHLLVSELVDGRTLRERLREGALPLAEALDVAIQVARGLAAAHTAGIVHRDVKPENVMLRRDGLVKIVDFGVAKSVIRASETAGGVYSTTAGKMVGTLAYMSPEQARGQPVDARTDVWSLGVVLYEMVTGESPFAGETPSDRLAAILERTPPPPSVGRRQLPRALDRILEHALAKHREDRHPDAAALLADLERLRNDLARGAARPPRGRRLVVAAAIVGLLLAGAMTIGWWVRSRTGLAAIDSVAVLPLTVEGKDAELELAGEGISDGLIRRLAGSPGLRVLARFSSFPYAGKTLPPGQVTRELGVRGLVVGRVQPHAGLVAVDVELVDGRDGSRLWGAQYERPTAALAVLEGEIAGDLQRALGRPSQPAAAGDNVALHVPNAEAYRLYQSGRHYWSSGTRAGFDQSRDLFQRAIESDPDYALAWVGMSHWYSFGAANGYLRPEEYWPRAEQTARHALALAPQLPEVYNAATGMPLYRDHDWAAGERLLDEGLRFGESAELLNHYALYLGATGRTEEALRMCARAAKVDPGRDAWRRGAALYYGRRVEESVAAFRAAPDNPNALASLAAALAVLGRGAEAFATYQRALGSELTPELGAALQRAYDAGGFPAARAVVARSDLQNLEQRAARGEYVSAYSYFFQYHLLGDRERALQWAERAFREPNRLVLLMAADPRFDDLHSDPRFRAGVASLHLPAATRR